MGPGIDPPHPLGAHVGIDLRGGQAFVAEQFLDGPEVGAVVEHVGGETVPERVGTHAAGEAGDAGVLLQHPTHTAGAEASPVLVEEEGFPVHPGPPAPVTLAQVQVVLEGSHRRPTDGGDPLLAPLSPQEGHLSEAVQIAQVELDQFAYAHSGAVEQFQDGPVAGAQEGVGRRSREQPLHLRQVQALGESSLEFRRPHGACRVLLHLPLAYQELVETAEGGDLPGYRGAGVVPLPEVGEIAAQVRRGGRPGVALVAVNGGEELYELLQIGGVTAQGVRRDVASQVEILQEALRQGKGRGSRLSLPPASLRDPRGLPRHRL